MTEYIKYSENNKIINSLRKVESFYFQNFFYLQKIKEKIFTEDEDNWNNLKEYLLEKNEIPFVLKNGFRLNVKKIKELARNDERKELFHYFYFPNDILLKLIKKEHKKNLENLKKEETFIINNIICMHYPLIVKIISKPIKKQPFLSNYFYTLFNEGILGIINAIHKFNDNKGAKFSTYAFKWILYFVNKEVASIIKQIDVYNGNYNKHLFKSYKFLKPNKSYEDLKEDFKNAEIDIISLFDKIDFSFEKKKIHTAFNAIMNNSALRNKFLLHIKKHNKNSKIRNVLLSDLDDKIKTRKILEILYPSLEEFKISDYEQNVINKKEETNNLITYNEKEHINIYNQDLIEKIIKTANLTEEEKDIIYEFLKTEEFTNKVNKVIKKIQKNIKGKEHFFI